MVSTTGFWKILETALAMCETLILWMGGSVASGTFDDVAVVEDDAPFAFNGVVSEPGFVDAEL